MQKTDIDWCDMSWNPVTGCLHNCEYCYARGIARRFKGNGDLRELETGLFLEESRFEIAPGIYDIRYPLTRGERPEPCEKYKGTKTHYPFDFAPTFHRYRLNEPASIKKPQAIFVGSMCDLFGEFVPDEWIEKVFAACADAPQHRYLFLTKSPERYRPLNDAEILPKSDNFWFGTTITKSADVGLMNYTIDYVGLPEPTHRNTFVSIEPIFDDVSDLIKYYGYCFGWIIVGAESGNRKDKVIPKWEWIDNIVTAAREVDRKAWGRKQYGQGVPVFMKESLRDLMGGDFVQEYPWEVRL